MLPVGTRCPDQSRNGVAWLNRAARQGYPDAQFTLGCLYEHGEIVSCDLKEARRWYRGAADQGQPDACYRLGVLLVRHPRRKRYGREGLNIFSVPFVGNPWRRNIFWVCCIFAAKFCAETGAKVCVGFNEPPTPGSRRPW